MLRLILIAHMIVALVGLPLQEGNLLVNGGMEGNYSAQDGIPQIQMPNGWRAWWVEGGGSEYWMNMRPEWSTSESWAHPERVKEGSRAMRYFKGWGTFTAGAYQTVSGITPGTPLEFTVWGQAWSCVEWKGCSQEQTSGPPIVWSTNDPAKIHLRIGIDPTGGTDVFSPNVVWSPEASALDQYVQFRVTATAQADKVTVFLYASQDGPPAAENQDAYWDGAVLRATGAGSSSGGGGETASGWVGVAVIPTYPPQPDGRIVHTVRSGETLGGIALAYGLESATALCKLNEDVLNGTCRFITPGQQLFIGYAPTPVPTKADSGIPAAGDTTGGGAAAPAPAPAQPTATPTPVATVGTICVMLFEDADQDGMRGGDEVPLSSGEVLLKQGQTVLATYRASGADTPYCFTDLAPGMYTMTASAPAGYGFTRSPQLAVNVVAGVQQDIAFGAARGVEVAQTSFTPIPAGIPNAPRTGIGGVLAQWAGVIVLGLCAVAVVGWVVWQWVRRQ